MNLIDVDINKSFNVEKYNNKLNLDNYNLK